MSQIGCFSRLVGFMFLVGLIAVGGFLVYQAGMAQGLAQAPDLADAAQVAPPVSNPNGFLGGLGFPSFFSFFGTICISVLFIFLFFGLLRFISCAVRFGKQDWQTPNSNLDKAI